MGKTVILVVYTLVTAVFTFTCGIKEVPSVTPLLGNDGFPGGEPSKEAWEKKWEYVLKVSKKEGKVIVFIGAGGEVRNVLVREFTRKYGVEVEAISARGAEFVNRIIAERKAGIYNLDVYQSGITTVLLTLKPAGILDSIGPSLILPEVTNPQAWWKGDIHWVENGHLALNFLAYPSTPLAINTNLVKLEEIKSYNDLLNPKWRGKMTINDPSQAGAGGNLVGVQGDNLMGYEWLRRLAEQQPIIMRDRRLQIEWLATGKYPISISPDTTPLMEFKDAGAPVVGITPIEGTHVTGGYGTLALVNKAPHPMAARLYINWLLSREGQEIYSRTALTQSGRVDIPTDFLPQDRVRQPRVNYVDQASEVYTLKHPEYLKIAEEIFGHLMK